MVHVVLRVGLISQVICLHRKDEDVLVQVVFLVVKDLHDLLERVHLAHHNLLARMAWKAEVFDDLPPLAVLVVTVAVKHRGGKAEFLGLIWTFLSHLQLLLSKAYDKEVLQ